MRWKDCYYYQASHLVVVDPDEIQVSIFLEIAALTENEDVENVERVFVDVGAAVAAMM